jgi:hypothetical protein
VQNQICVSSDSLGELLGPIRLTRRGPDGKQVPVTWGEGQPTLTLRELPAQIKTKLGLDAVEICQFHVRENTPAYLILARCAPGALGSRFPPARKSAYLVLCAQRDRSRLPWP